MLHAYFSCCLERYFYVHFNSWIVITLFYHINILKSLTHKLGSRVQLVFKITQHSRDELLMKNLVSYFNCGKLYKFRETIDFRVSKFEDFTNIILPFFIKYPIVGVKALEFVDFCKVADLMKNGKAHLTAEGVEQIGKIKDGMNKGRK